MLAEFAVIALVAILIVRSMIRSSERRVMEYCRGLALRNFEAIAAAAKQEPSDLLDAMAGAADAMPDLPQ